MYDAKCGAPDCEKQADSKGLCKVHSRQLQRGTQYPGITASQFGIRLNPKCELEWCDRLSATVKPGLCTSHRQQKRGGFPFTPLRDYGVYVEGKVGCGVETCERVASVNGLCSSHDRKSKDYHLTPVELAVLAQIEVCQNPGCDNTERLFIDHDHTTGKVRDVLCNGCNSALGFLGEDIKRAEGLIEYIKTHTVTPFSTEDVPEIMSNPRNP